MLAAHEAAEKRARQAEEDVRLLNESHDAIEVKLKALSPHESCACSYDREGDVCLHHSPALVAVTAERDSVRDRAEAAEASARAANEKLRALGADLQALGAGASRTADREELRRIAHRMGDSE